MLLPSGGRLAPQLVAKPPHLQAASRQCHLPFVRACARTGPTPGNPARSPQVKVLARSSRTSLLSRVRWRVQGPRDQEQSPLGSPTQDAGNLELGPTSLTLESGGAEEPKASRNLRCRRKAADSPRGPRHRGGAGRGLAAPVLGPSGRGASVAPSVASAVGAALALHSLQWVSFLQPTRPQLEKLSGTWNIPVPVFVSQSVQETPMDSQIPDVRALFLEPPGAVPQSPSLVGALYPKPRSVPDAQRELLLRPVPPSQPPCGVPSRCW